MSDQVALDGKQEQFGQLQTDGREIRRVINPVNALLDECRVDVNNGELLIEGVDPVNVGLVRVKKSVETPDTETMGFNFTVLRDAVSEARYGKGSADPLTITFGRPLTTVELTREYANDRVTYSEDVETIDPDSLRPKPDMELFPWTDNVVTVDTEAFTDVVLQAHSASDKGILLQPSEGGVSIESLKTPFTAEIETGRDSHVTAPSGARYSTDYLKDMVKALEFARVESVTLCWGETVPLTIIAQDPGFRLEYGLAPRIGDDD